MAYQTKRSAQGGLRRETKSVLSARINLLSYVGGMIMGGWHSEGTNMQLLRFMGFTLCRQAFVLAGLLGVQTAAADFVPGRLYISAPVIEGCHSPIPGHDLIYEFDPQTGGYSVFATIPDELCEISGLAFTPDGSKLRISSFYSSSILELDGNGGITKVLGPQNGIAGPYGSNNIGYDTAGNFYVGNNGPNTILKFAPGATTGQVLATQAQGIYGWGALDIAPDGDVYYIEGTEKKVFRIPPGGEPSLFASNFSVYGIYSLAVDSAENVYALTPDAVYRFAGGDPNKGAMLATVTNFYGGSITLSSDERFIYAARSGLTDNIFEIDVTTGMTQVIGSIPYNGQNYLGAGMTVYLPEPASVLMFSIVACACSRRLLARSS